MRNVSKDLEKAQSLADMTKNIQERIQETDKEQFPSQVLRDYYDILHKLLEAIAATHGKKSSGKGAHRKLIEWAADTFNLEEQDRQFLQQVRKYRNRITYEGFTIEYDYLERNEEQIQDLINYFREQVQNQFKPG